MARPRAGRGRAADARREPVDILEVVTWGGGQPADGFDDDDTPRGPLLPPDDRIWRHPSEVGAALRGRASRVRRRSRLPKPSRNWRIALLAGTIGGMLAAGVAAATDVFGTRTGTSVVRLVRVAGNKLDVVGLDCLDGTPLLDLKPYFASTDAVADAVVGWHAGRH